MDFEKENQTILSALVRRSKLVQNSLWRQNMYFCAIQEKLKCAFVVHQYNMLHTVHALAGDTHFETTGTNRRSIFTTQYILIFTFLSFLPETVTCAVYSCLF